MSTKARELQPNLHRLQAYEPPDPTRIRHDAIWQRALERWQPGKRVVVTFPAERAR